MKKQLIWFALCAMVGTLAGPSLALATIAFTPAAVCAPYTGTWVADGNGSYDATSGATGHSTVCGFWRTSVALDTNDDVVMSVYDNSSTAGTCAVCYARSWNGSSIYTSSNMYTSSGTASTSCGAGTHLGNSTVTFTDITQVADGHGMVYCAFPVSAGGGSDASVRWIELLEQ